MLAKFTYLVFFISFYYFFYRGNCLALNIKAKEGFVQKNALYASKMVR